MSVTPSPERKRERGTPPDAPSKKIRLSPDADRVATPSKKVKLDFGPDTHELDVRVITVAPPGSDESLDMTRRMAKPAPITSKSNVDEDEDQVDVDADDINAETHEIDLRTVLVPPAGSDEYQDMARRMAEAAQNKSKLTFQIGGLGAGTFLSTDNQALIHSQTLVMESVARRWCNMRRSTTIQIQVDPRMFCRPGAAQKLYATYTEHCSEKDTVGFEDFLQVTGVEEMLQAYADDRDIAAKLMECDYNDVVGIYDSCKEMGAALRFV
jgi:hypothetical protein